LAELAIIAQTTYSVVSFFTQFNSSLKYWLNRASSPWLANFITRFIKLNQPYFTQENIPTALTCRVLFKAFFCYILSRIVTDVVDRATTIFYSILYLAPRQMRTITNKNVIAVILIPYFDFKTILRETHSVAKICHFAVGAAANKIYFIGYISFAFSVLKETINRLSRNLLTGHSA
jgi:hypothetical protein